jgi:hypothetical protein
MVAHPGTACGNTWDPLKGMPLTWRLFHLSLRLWNIVNSFWICLALLILFVDTGIWRKKLWWTRQSVFRFNHPLKEPQRYIWDLECGAFHGIPNGDFWSFGRGLIQSTQVEPSSKEHENDRCQPGWSRGCFHLESSAGTVLSASSFLSPLLLGLPPGLITLWIYESIYSLSLFVNLLLVNYWKIICEKARFDISISFASFSPVGLPWKLGTPKSKV